MLLDWKIPSQSQDPLCKSVVLINTVPPPGVKVSTLCVADSSDTLNPKSTGFENKILCSINLSFYLSCMLVTTRQFSLTAHCRLAVTYGDLRSIPEFAEKTVLAIKAPPDTVLSCDAQEVRKETRACSRAVTEFQVHRCVAVLCIMKCQQSMH